MQENSSAEALTLSGLILAGGRATRMNGDDKGLVNLLQMPLIEHVQQRFQPQVAELIISANRNLAQYQHYADHVVSDIYAGFPGPLAGIHAALGVLEHDYLLCVPCDSPRLPVDLGRRLSQAILDHPQQKLAVAHDGQYLQPLFLLVHRSLKPGLEAFLNADQHKVGAWVRAQSPCIVDFSDQPAAFENLNAYDELHRFATVSL